MLQPAGASGRTWSVPTANRWSSFRSNAGLTPMGWLVPHEVYLRLGGTAAERIEAYRALFRTALDPEDIAAIRVHCQEELRARRRAVSGKHCSDGATPRACRANRTPAANRGEWT